MKLETLSKSSVEIQENDLSLDKLKDNYGGTIVLKGNNTLMVIKIMSQISALRVTWLQLEWVMF